MMTSEQTHPLSEALHWAVGQAVQAPSLHNAQPWRFRIRGAGVDVRADRSRSLPVIDADGRELATSCGAALFHLRIALRTKGLDVDVRRLPDPLDPDLIARVIVKPGQAPTEELRLCAAIATRRTSRAPYLGITVPDEVIERLRRDAETEGAWFAPLTEEAQRISSSPWSWRPTTCSGATASCGRSSPSGCDPTTARPTTAFPGTRWVSTTSSRTSPRWRYG